MESNAPAEATATLLVNQYGERYLYEVNRDTFNRTGAQSVFSRHFGDTLQGEHEIHIIVGTDSGLLPAYVAAQGVPRGSRFLFIELPEILDTLRAQQLIDTDQERIHFTTPEAWYDTAESLGLTDYFYIDGAHLHESLGATDANLAVYRLLVQEVRERFDALQWKIMQGLQTRFFLNIKLLNIAENRHPAALLKQDAFKGTTAVLLAGGPSLDELLPWVAANREQVTVIAVSRVCRRLREVGLTPDIVVSIDPTQLSFDISKEILHFENEVTLVNADHVNPHLLGQWHGRNLYLGKQYPWDTPRNADNIPVVGPTVTNAALLFASEMGFGQIVLAGVDLCLSPEGFTHARGSNEHQAGPHLGLIGLSVETNNGQHAETRHDFAHAIHAISIQAEAARNAGCRIINPAPLAAKVEHVEHIEPGQIEILPLERPAREIIAGALPADRSADRRLAHEDIIDELAAMRAALEKVARLADKAIEVNRTLFSAAAGVEHKKALNRIEHDLENKHAAVVTFLKRYAIKDFLKLTQPGEDAEWTNAEAEQTAHRYYEILADSARNVAADLDTVGERTATRVEEEAQAPDIAALTAQWRNDGQPGRAQVWMKQHPEAADRLTSEQREVLAALIQEFQAGLENRDTIHARKIIAETDLHTVRSKAALLFQQGNRGGLAHLLDALQATPHNDAAAYANLVRGYLAELDGNPGDAIQAYQAIEGGPVLEDALKRITYLSLDRFDLENACLALECLSHLSAGYLAQYADVLRLCGDLQQAAEAYMQYLDNAPDDLATAIKFGRLHQEVGNTDVAAQIFDYVLNKDPANRAARNLRDNLEQTA